MSYCTPSDLIRAVGGEQLADMLGAEPGDLSADIAIADAIAAAASRIDGYLIQAGYSLPVSVTVPALTRAAADMAVYYLFSARRQGDIEDALGRYHEQVGWLEAVAAGSTKIAELEAVGGKSGTGEVIVITSNGGIHWSGY